MSEDLVALGGRDITDIETDQLAELRNQCAVVEAVVARIKDEVKRRLEAGLEVPGWALQEGSGKRNHAPGKAQELWQIASEMGVTPEVWVSLMRVSVASVEKAVLAVSDNQREARKEFRARTAHIVRQSRFKRVMKG